MRDDKKHVFIVEDEAELSYSMQLMLELEGFAVSSANDGLQALGSIKSLNADSSPVDLLITDIQLPGISGIELVDELRRNGLDIPIMAITGFGDKEIVVDLMRRGCVEYLDKPFKPKRLLGLVKNFFEKDNNRKNINKYAIKLTNQVEAYKQVYEELTCQINSAIETYQGIMAPKDTECRVLTASKYLPLAGLGGDFAVIKNSEKGCDVLLTDVAGHDIGASYFTVLIKAFFDEHHRNIDSGEQFLKQLNGKMLESANESQLVTAVYMKLDLENMRGVVTTAGHPPVGYIKPGVPFVQFLKSPSDVLGIHEEPELKSFDISFLPGDRFILHTDGLVDVFNSKQSGEERRRLSETGFQGFIEKHMTLPLQAMVEEIWGDVMRFSGFKTVDDALLLALEIPEEN